MRQYAYRCDGSSGNGIAVEVREAIRKLTSDWKIAPEDLVIEGHHSQGLVVVSVPERLRKPSGD